MRSFTIYFTLIILLIINNIIIINGSFNVYEVDKILYDVAINSDPILNSEVSTKGNFMPMTNKYGQKYQCELPDISSLEEENPDKKAQVLSLDEFNKVVQEQLQSMGKSSCIYKTKDWWTYELCPGKYIKQYHLKNGKIEGDVMVLGSFDRNYIWKDEDRLNGNRKHLTQFYENGTPCGVASNAKRLSEVKYFCDPNAIMDTLIDINEPRICEYILTVSSNQLCNITELKPKQTHKMKQLNCQPILSEKEYKGYQKMDEDRRLKTEKSFDTFVKNLQDEVVSQLKSNNDWNGDLNDDVYIQRILEEKLTSQIFNNIMKMDGQSTNRISRAFTPQEKFYRILNEIIANKGGAGKEKQANKKVQVKDQIKKDTFNIEMERKVRNDKVSDEEMDLLINNVITKFTLENKLFEQRNEEQFSDMIQDLMESVKEIIDETEKEMGIKLSSEQSSEVLSYTKKIIFDLRKILKGNNKFPDENVKDNLGKRNSKSIEKLLQNYYTAMNEFTKFSKDDLEDNKDVRHELKKVVDDFINKLEDDMGSRLKPEDYEVVQKNVNELNSILDNIKIIDKKIESVEKEMLNDDIDYNQDRTHYKHDNKKSVKKELREEDFEKPTENKPGNVKNEKPKTTEKTVKSSSTEKVEKQTEIPKEHSESSETINIALKDIPNQNVRGLDSQTEEKIAKRVESLIRSRLNGNQGNKRMVSNDGIPVEIRVVTIDVDDVSLLEGKKGKKEVKLEGNEFRQIRDMINNVMLGNEKGYEDIESMRRLERGYKFNFKNTQTESSEEKNSENTKN